MNYLIFFLASILVSISHQGINAQSPKSPLSRVINVSGTAQVAPSLSGDGKHMIFTTTSNLKSELLVFYSYQQQPGKWTQPKPVDVINRSQKINHIGGYSLTYDGNYIFFTSRKTYGIGKYDIWYSKRIGDNEWSPPLNLGKPVNSTLDDGCPSLSPDGKTLFFVRCLTMDQKEGTGCKLMMVKKRNQESWGEPEELPVNINDGNILSPKILADNQTLLYAKGQGDAWDLYQTRLGKDGWSDPVSLDFINTSDGDERFASVSARGDIIYYSAMYKGTYDIIKAKIPYEMQPLKVTYVKGQVLDQQGASLEAFIQIYDVEEQNLIQYYRTKSNDSNFEFYIPAGKQYDFSVVPLASEYTFYSEILDLRDLDQSKRKKLNITLEGLDHGISFPLRCLQFETDTTLSKISRFEMSRLIKLLKNNPGIQVEISVHREAYEIDSIQFLEDSTYLSDALVTESSLMIIDSLQIPEEVATVPPPDVTALRAEAVSKYLQERGVPDYLIIPKGYADEHPIGPNETEEQRMLNRRVEIKVL